MKGFVYRFYQDSHLNIDRVVWTPLLVVGDRCITNIARRPRRLFVRVMDCT